MTNLAARVRRYAARQGLWRPGARVVAAVSGGGDSVALLRLLRELAAGGEVVLAGVAHLNHQLRASADRDEAFCRALADEAGVPFDVGAGRHRRGGRAARCSVEVAARAARYAFFEQVRAGARPTSWPSPTRAMTRPKRCCCGCCAAPGTRGLRGALPGEAPSSGRS